ncbi:ABC transporter ATP-binding protein [Mesorhizobium sp. CN2-181]
MAPSKSVLDVQGLTTAFRAAGGWRDVVKGIGFSVGENETVAIVGESGSGKSVTALSVMRLLDGSSSRSAGKILLQGKDLLSLSERRMQQIRGNDVAMIFQEPMSTLNPVLSIGAQIGEALLLHRNLSRDAIKAETLRLLDRVRIPSARQRFDEYPHQLSGGMRQRVVIAMALACQPKLLIADEPTTALDVTIQAEILDLVAEVQRDIRSSVLFITHDMGVVAEIADRTIVMLDGRIVEHGRTAELFKAPQHVYTRRLLAAVPRLGSMEGLQRPARFPTVDPITGALGPTAEVVDTVAAAHPPLLEVRNLVMRFRSAGGLLTKAQGRVHAVENVSFIVNAGETLALVGESGCGKSTTGRSIVGLAKPNAGQVLIEGTDVLAGPAAATRPLRNQIQMIFQDPYGSLNPRMNVGDAIAEPIIVHRHARKSEARDEAVELLRLVGLSPDMAARYPHEFSGGQRQRVCIARALALKPRLIIADEAVSALDVSIKAQVVNLLLDLQESLKTAFLFISHDIAVVERVSHRIAVMYRGEIVEIGPRSAVLGNPQHPYTRQLLAAVPNPDPDLRRAHSLRAPSEPVSTVRPLDYVPPERAYRQVAPDHFVHAEPDETALAA